MDNHETDDLHKRDNTEKRILLIGGGGHCRSVLDTILSLDVYSKVGIVDFEGSSVLGVPIVGTDNELPRLIQDGWTDAFVTIGSIGDTSVRHRLYQLVKELGYHIPTIIDPSSLISREVKLGEGTYIGKKVTVNTGSMVGCCAIINTGAIVEHDCIAGDFVHVSSGATLCGRVFIGADSHIGAGTIVRQQIKIGKQSIIGVGSVVVKDIADNVKAFGNPCRVVEEWVFM